MKLIILLSFLFYLYSCDNIKNDYTYFEDGKIESVIPWRNKKIDGVVKRYYYNGNIMFQVNIKNNKGDGKYFYESGNIMSKGTYIVKGEVAFKKVGKHTFYYETGELSAYIYYDSIWGKKKVIGFHKNGNISQKEYYKRATEDGLWQYYNETGKLEKVLRYNKGKIIYKKYFPNTFESQWGWNGSVAWQELIEEIKKMGNISSLKGKVPTEIEAEKLLDEAGLEAIQVWNKGENGLEYRHFVFIDSAGNEGTIRVR